MMRGKCKSRSKKGSLFSSSPTLGPAAMGHAKGLPGQASCIPNEYRGQSSQSSSHNYVTNCHSALHAYNSVSPLGDLTNDHRFVPTALTHADYRLQAVLRFREKRKTQKFIRAPEPRETLICSNNKRNTSSAFPASVKRNRHGAKYFCQDEAIAPAGTAHVFSMTSPPSYLNDASDDARTVLTHAEYRAAAVSRFCRKSRLDKVSSSSQSNASGPLLPKSKRPNKKCGVQRLSCIPRCTESLTENQETHFTSGSRFLATLTPHENLSDAMHGVPTVLTHSEYRAAAVLKFRSKRKLARLRYASKKKCSSSLPSKKRPKNANGIQRMLIRCFSVYIIESMLICCLSVCVI